MSPMYMMYGQMGPLSNQSPDPKMHFDMCIISIYTLSLLPIFVPIYPTGIYI